MNEIKQNVEICSDTAPGISPTTIKSLMSDVADLANAAFVRVARVNLEVLGIETADLPDSMASSLQEALETHRYVLAALCDNLDALIQGLGVRSIDNG